MGSMLIWDAGEDEVLSYHETTSQADTDDDDDETNTAPATLPQPKKLQQSFQERKICLRLHGIRLPRNYTLLLRLTKDNYRTEQPKRPFRKRKRQAPNAAKRRHTPETSDSDSELPLSFVTSTGLHNNQNPTSESSFKARCELSSLSRAESPPSRSKSTVTTVAPHTAATDSEFASKAIHLTNAYAGATNSISPIYQCKWYLSLDRRACGFAPTGKSKGLGARVWIRWRNGDGGLDGFERFRVLGRNVESVVTGRLGKDVLRDEGVKGFVHKGLWKPVTE